MPPFANVFDARKRSREIQNARSFRPKTSRRKKNERTKKKRRRRRRRGKKARTRWQFPRLRSRSRLARFFSIVVERTLLRFLCVCERVKCFFCARRKVPLIFEKNLLQKRGVHTFFRLPGFSHSTKMITYVLFTHGTAT